MGEPDNEVNQDVEAWPPKRPDMSWHDAFSRCVPENLSTSMSEIYRFKNSPTIYKTRTMQREYDLMVAAGECSITPYGRVLKQPSGQVYIHGILMELGTPVDPQSIPPSERRGLVTQMISVVRALHDKGIVHGDIKPNNMLLRANGQLVLCDFAEARWVDEDPALWEGKVTDNYSSPNRCRNWPDLSDPAPEIIDDLYSLGVSIWELYTCKMPFTDWYVDDILDYVKLGNTVDIGEVEDPEVREIIREYVRYGGAEV